MHRLFQALAMLALLTPFAWADQASETPEAVVRSISDQLNLTLSQNREHYREDPSAVWQLADKILMPHVDTDAVSSGVLGKYWRSATPEQRSAFTQEFKQLLLRTYAAAFADLPAWELELLAARGSRSDEGTVVRSRVRVPSAQPTHINYHMHRPDKEWLVYDVKIEGISLVKTYQSGFAREVRSKGLDGLIERLATINRQRAGA